MDEKSGKREPEIHKDGFEIPTANYREKRFPNRDLCPKWIQYLAGWNESEIVTALHRATPGSRRYIVECWARTTCPPTCPCSYRFQIEFPVSREKSEPRVYCNDLDMMALHSNPQATQYEPPKADKRTDPKAAKKKGSDSARKLKGFNEL